MILSIPRQWVDLPAAQGLVVNAGGVLAPEGEAVVREVGQDGTGDFAGAERTEVEGQLVVFEG